MSKWYVFASTYAYISFNINYKVPGIKSICDGQIRWGYLDPRFLQTWEAELRSYMEFFNVLWKELLIIIIRKSKIRGKLDRLNSLSPSNPELRRGQPCSPSHQPSLRKPRALRGVAVAGVSLRSCRSVPPVRRHVPIIHGTGYRTRERMPCDQTQGPKPHPSAITVHLGKASYGVLVKLYQLKSCV